MSNQRWVGPAGLFASGALMIILDRILKGLALAGVTKDFGQFRFIAYRNDGIIFSWPLPAPVLFPVLALALGAIIWRLVIAWRRRQLWIFVGFGLIALGAINNGYDRLVHGWVIDWAYLGPWFPVFNLSDFLIIIGFVVSSLPMRPWVDEKPQLR